MTGARRTSGTTRTRATTDDRGAPPGGGGRSTSYEVNDMTDDSVDDAAVHRRTFLKLGLTAGGLAALGAVGAGDVPDLRRRGLFTRNGFFEAVSAGISDKIYIEDSPTSPLILTPFVDELVIPKALAPIAKSVYSSWSRPPGPGIGQQTNAGDGKERHQM